MMEMPTIKLNTGAEIPALGFGTWKLSRSEAKKSVADALEIGYRHIDTARIYRNENQVGEAVISSGLDRGELFITTKLWNSDQGYDSAFKALDASLERLGMDYVDLYLIHWPGHDARKRADSWKALSEMHEQGLAKAVGVSNYMVRHLEELLESSEVIPAVNQIEFHPFLYEEQKELLEFCKRQGIVFEAYSPLARGRLSDPLLADIGGKFGKTASQVMLRWALQQGTVPLPRSSKQPHILENFQVFDFELSDDDMTAINQIRPGSHTGWDPTDLP